MGQLVQSSWVGPQHLAHEASQERQWPCSSKYSPVEQKLAAYCAPHVRTAWAGSQGEPELLMAAWTVEITQGIDTAEVKQWPGHIYIFSNHTLLGRIVVWGKNGSRVLAAIWQMWTRCYPGRWPVKRRGRLHSAGRFIFPIGVHIWSYPRTQGSFTNFSWMWEIITKRVERGQLQ